MLGEDLAVSGAGELTAPIGVDDESPSRLSLAQGHTQRGDREWSLPASPLEAVLRVTLPAGANTAIARGVGDSTPGLTGVGLVELYDLHLSENRAANISTRGNVLPADSVMIAGIIGGSEAKELIFRPLGPSLQDRGAGDAVGNPQLQVISEEGVVLAASDDWEDGADAPLIASSKLGPESPLEAAVHAILSPGLYAAIASPALQDSGIGLIEVYDLTPSPAWATDRA